MKNLKFALRYAEFGWPVLPLCWPDTNGNCACGRDHPPQAVGKAPLTEHGHHDATTNPDTIQEWWSQWPQANIGIALEPAGLLVLDLDGPEALEEAKAKGLPPSPVVKTGRGEHRYFLNPWPGMATATKRGDSSGIDVKLTGFVVAPPSLHRSGKTYVWALTPKDAPLVEAPEWVRELLRPHVDPAAIGLPKDLPKVEVEELRIPERIKALIATGKRDGYPSRSEAGFAAICALLEAGHGEEETAAAILAHPIGEYVRERAKGDPERARTWLAGEIARAKARLSMSATEEGIAPVIVTGPPRLTDSGNAERLVALHGKDLRYCYAWKTWLVWDGKRWKKDGQGEVERRAKDTVRDLYAEASHWGDEHTRQSIAKWAIQSESERRIRAMISLARSEPGISVLPEELDRNPWLFNVANGTLDLRTGELRPHRREDLITKLSPVEYDPEAKAPLWESFLERVLQDEELIAFIQRAVGYALTGDTSEQVLFLLYGTGANGKSTFLETIRAMLGDYAQHTSFETFLARRGEGVRNDIARLVSARLVTAQEVESGRRLAESLVKLLTGGDTVTARFLYSEYFEFKPEFKLFLAANHKPIIRGTDLAIWRRIRLIPFTVTIPPEEQDHRLGEKLKKELPGILAWAVRGCLEWQERGLGLPPQVKAATEAYREEMDILAAFLNERCVISPEAVTPAKDLYAAYTQWCFEYGERPETQRSFGMRLSERGFERTKHKGRCHWRGITLVDRVDDVDDVDQVSEKSLYKDIQKSLPKKGLPWSTSSTQATAPCAHCGAERPVEELDEDGWCPECQASDVVPF